MKRLIVITCLGIIISLLIYSCSDNDDNTRSDGAYRLDIDLDGSLQNPAFSSDGNAIVFTRFRDGYNQGAADLYVYDLVSGVLTELVSDGSVNVNLPGSCWNQEINQVVFSSDRNSHDEIFLVKVDSVFGSEWQVTKRLKYMAFEPSFSPDGEDMVFESHEVDVESNGVILRYAICGCVRYFELTDPSHDCRQPNWSPQGDLILYQRLENGAWDIWTVGIDGNNHTKITNSEGDNTDAVFSGDGNWIIYSSDEELEYASIYKIAIEGTDPVRLTTFHGYDGSPSVSSDGAKLVFESSSEHPEDSDGTQIWIKDL